MEKPRLSVLVEKIFFGVMVFLANQIVEEARAISHSIQALNQKMAVMVTNVGYQEKRVDSLEYRVQNLEAARFKK